MLHETYDFNQISIRFREKTQILNKVYSNNNQLQPCKQKNHKKALRWFYYPKTGLIRMGTLRDYHF